MQSSFAHPMRRMTGGAIACPRTRPRVPWKGAGLAALLCSGVAWASLPRASQGPSDERREWHALAIAPLSRGGVTGMRMEPSAAVEPIDVAPTRAAPFAPAEAKAPAAPADNGPLRITGRIGDGLYWSLRAAGASPAAAAQYLAALATEIDVGGDVGPSDRFDLVLGGQGGGVLYAGLDRAGQRALQLVRWTANGRSEWIDAANAAAPAPVERGMLMPAAGRITSYFGNRYHPILHFTRFHAGIDIGAAWGSPIVAAGDGQVVGAGWSGGYGRQVRIAHAGGLLSSYGHMSQIVVAPGTIVRQGQLIGYVGSSGLSTGPHVHFEVKQDGTPVNPLGVRFAGTPLIDSHLADAVKARLKALLGVGAKRG